MLIERTTRSRRVGAAVPFAVYLHQLVHKEIFTSGCEASVFFSARKPPRPTINPFEACMVCLDPSVFNMGFPTRLAKFHGKNSWTARVYASSNLIETAKMNHPLSGFRKVSWRMIDRSGSRISDTELVAVPVNDLILTYLDELKTPSNSEATHITIKIQQSTTLAPVEVIRDTQGVDLSGPTSAN
ncbi:hypothetical protein CROQUDRAFT_88470 [Cronartium quercuum f. sp. fusiforme G11]|uniref:Uncharacterized protein n=1 Tax=Cronartium quercuum f. sp. fusiforme G11 TaxID=708437 RepID=A0A9P6NMM2_9BASI|nr:hypothetical protein CROQUDRAFT_88470 [Cronartium quercuum f. sp. fusiforme G11]